MYKVSRYHIKQQTKGNDETMEAMEHFSDCCATHPTATVRFQASDMILKMHSDASHSSETEARSRLGGHFCLGNKDKSMKNNGAIHVTAKTIKNVVFSASNPNCVSFLPAREVT